MSEWWTYHLSDFLLFSRSTYYRLFEIYNTAIWPAQVVAVALGLLILALLWRRAEGSRGRLIAAIVAACWLWVGIAFHASRYATINWAAIGFAWAFGIEAALLIGMGVIRGSLRFDRQAGGVASGSRDLSVRARSPAAHRSAARARMAAGRSSASRPIRRPWRLSESWSPQMPRPVVADGRARPLVRGHGGAARDEGALLGLACRGRTERGGRGATGAQEEAGEFRSRVAVGRAAADRFGEAVRRLALYRMGSMGCAWALCRIALANARSFS
jgi:hypothetical protein